MDWWQHWWIETSGFRGSTVLVAQTLPQHLRNPSQDWCHASPALHSSPHSWHCRGVGFSLPFLDLLGCPNFPEPWDDAEQCWSCNFPPAGNVSLSFGSLRSCWCPVPHPLPGRASFPEPGSGFGAPEESRAWPCWGDKQPAVRETTLQVTASLCSPVQ